jgi:hypothetical protein
VQDEPAARLLPQLLVCEKTFAAVPIKETVGAEIVETPILVKVAATIAKAIGKPDLKYVQAPADQFRSVLVQMGMSAQFAALLLEMIGSLNSGSMRALEPRTPQNTTPTTYDAFVSEYFVPAYQQQAAA